jgi:hypothetical protein
MVEWKGLTIQLVSVLLGSSVIITILSSVYSGINQPHINISIDPQTRGFGVFSDVNRLDRTLTTTIVNDGRAAAHNVTVRLDYPDAANIEKVEIQKATEITADFNNIENAQISQTRLERLSTGGKIVVETTYILPNSTRFSDDYNNPCIVYVSYEEGSEVSECSSNSFFDNFSSLLRIEILFIPLLVAIILLAIKFIPLQFRRIRDNKKRFSFASNIKREMAAVYNAFKNDILSKRIFLFRLWESFTSDNKRKIFNNYDDYNRIEEFYSKLKERDLAFSNNNIAIESVKKLNLNCLHLAHDALKVSNG